VGTSAVLHLRPQTLRKAFSQKGAYFGVRPQKATNRRLFWNAQEIGKLKHGTARNIEAEHDDSAPKGGTE